jgi:TnpA family transposase
MKGDYPGFKATYIHEELVEHFLLSPAEHALVETCHGETNRHSVAVLLKTVQYLGYFPEDLQHVPPAIRTFVAHQLHLLWDRTADYPWQSSTRDRHLALIRQFTGWRFPTAEDKQALVIWLQTQAAPNAPTEADLKECAYRHLRTLGIELPTERELERLVRTALTGFFHELYHQITAHLTEPVRAALDALLVVGADETHSAFDQLKTDPAAPGIKPLQHEIAKLQTLRALNVPPAALSTCSDPVLHLLTRRALNERAGEMRAHPAAIRYALLACFIHQRTMEVIDHIVRMLLELIRRIDTQTEKHFQKVLCRDIKRVTGKVQLLFRVAEAVVEEPEGTIRDVLFPRVKEEIFHDLATEAKTTGVQYRSWYQVVMRQKYGHHYRQMLPLLLEHLTFRSDNRFQPVIEALAVIHRYLDTKGLYFPAEAPVPLDGVVLPSWRDTVLEEQEGTVRINRQYYELCVLQQLERALKCKEVWVEGASAFRNPSQDMPPDWQAAPQREAYYQALGQPVQVTSFLDPLRDQLTEALTQFNRDLPHNPHVQLVKLAANDERRLFAVERLPAQPEPSSLAQLKQHISQRYGMLDLLDVFVEAERLVGFTHYFRHSGTKEVRPREALRPLLLLDLFAEGTNTGIKRVATANQQYTYDELLYVRKHYISLEALRQANRAVVNKILALRDPRLWGEDYACASDGSRFASWSQNLMTEWRSRYKGYGVLVYWHVETNAVCLYSQLRNFSSSEVAAMIEGLIRHDTEMRVEKNFVDSHGQSEVAFAFCHLLGGIRLMPRLKRLKYERLYVPAPGMAASLPHLAGVLTRPIRWDLITQQYDEMIKHAVALQHGTATPEAILRRFNSYNVTHPTYKALAELGKAVKTIYLCEYLSSRDLRYEVQEGLNVVERWNAANDFLCYGRQGIFATNSREQQETTTLCLQLLQNCLMLINMLLVERSITQHQLLAQFTEADRRALTPLFYEHVNPYGLFALHLDQPSFLEAA